MSIPSLDILASFDCSVVTKMSERLFILRYIYHFLDVCCGQKLEAPANPVNLFSGTCAGFIIDSEVIFHLQLCSISNIQFKSAHFIGGRDQEIK